MATAEEVNTVFLEIESKDDAGKICEILAMNGYKVKAEFDNSYRQRYVISIDMIVVVETSPSEVVKSWIADLTSFFEKGGRLNHENPTDPASTPDTPYVYSDGIEIKHS